jgi:hypothetical protein
VSTLVDLPGGRRRLPSRNAFFLLFFFSSLLYARAQHANGRGAMSAQDMAKMSAAAGDPTYMESVSGNVPITIQ